MYTDTANAPGATLAYQQFAYNGAGYGASQVHRVKLPDVVPSVTSEVRVDVTSPTSILTQWNLTSSDGTISDEDKYFYEVVLQRTRRSDAPLHSTTTFSTPTRRKRDVLTGETL